MVGSTTWGGRGFGSRRGVRAARSAAAWVAASVVAATAPLSACALDGGTSAHEESASATIEPIIGGVPVTGYPETTLLDMRATDGQEYACSAVLIAPRVVLTAGHCVDGMVVWQAWANGVYASATHGETYDWHENGASTVDPSHHDIGLVYLDQPIVLPSYPTVAKAPVPDGAQVIDVGRIDNGVLTNSFFRAPIQVTSAAPFGYDYDYYAADVIEHGDSGGPVFVPGTHTIVAVNSGANTAVEVVARVDLLADWIAARVAAEEVGVDGGSAVSGGSVSPAAPADAGAGDGRAPTSAGPAKGQVGSGANAKDEERPAPPIACSAQEVEPNDTVSQANTLQGSRCGALQPGTDVDWFVFTAGAGAGRVTVAATDDAVLTIGYVTPSGGCSVVVPAIARLRSAAVTVEGAAGVPICVAVSSPAHIAQAYTVSVE